MTNSKSVVTIPQASEIFGISKHTLRNLCNQGTIKFFKSGRRYYIITSSLNNLLTMEDKTYEQH